MVKPTCLHVLVHGNFSPVEIGVLTSLSYSNKFNNTIDYYIYIWLY